MPEIVVAHDFAEPLDLAFGLEIDNDPEPSGAPIAQDAP